MKKLIIISFILTISLFYFYSQDTTSDISKKGLIEFLKPNIGNQISVYVKGADITLRGELIELYMDGITIITFFKQKIYIPIDSIGYIELNIKDKEQKNK